MKKKVLALIMAAAMTFGTMGMSTVAFASSIESPIENEGNTVAKKQITVAGAITKDTVIKCGLLIEPDQTSTTGWKFVDGYAQTFINAWNNQSNDDTNIANEEEMIRVLVGANVLEETKNLNAIAGTMHTNANLNAALSAVKAVATERMRWNNSTKKQEISARTTGLYVITAEQEGYRYAPMAAYIDTEGNGVAVQAKGAIDNVTKTVKEGGESVQKGDPVEYTVVDYYPFFSADTVAKAENKNYTITDTLTNAKFDRTQDVTVTLDGKPFAAAQASFENGDTVLKIEMGKYDAQYTGKKIEITYHATVDNAVGGDDLLENKVVSDKLGNQSEWTVKSDSVDFTVIKTEVKEKEEDPTVYLGGAVFTLYKAVSESGEGVETVTIDGKPVYLKEVTTATTTTEDEAKADPSKQVGYATFSGLDAQETYYVKETTAPTGYSVNENYFKLVLKEDPNIVAEENIMVNNEIVGIKYNFNDFSEQTITDTALSALPSTGGIGTTIFTIGGCVIMIAAAGIFFVSRKKENENK